MAKIGKIRIINFVYNENRHIYDQTFDFANGEDALLNLQNGGGKTVLVQMMMQPMVPKLKLKDRNFKSYFSNAKAPCYIMIEWILDGQSKRVLTGIGVKRILGKSADEGDERLKVITFLSEYEQGSRFDISNIELLEEERGVVRLLEFDKVMKNLSTAEKEGEGVWLYRWELPDDKREYNRRLLEYQIHPFEWKNLMVKINETEAGLNSFFSDCKTSNALIKKWFLPTIEDQLNQNGSFIENIRELIKNHAASRVKNEAMVKERTIFEAFRAKSEPLVEQLEEQETLFKRNRTCKENLGNAGEAVNRKLRTQLISEKQLQQEIEQTKETINNLEYERMSGEYHKVSRELKDLEKSEEELCQALERQEEVTHRLTYQRKVMLGLSCREELKGLSSRITGFETELQKESLKQEDQKEIIAELSFSLKEIYREREKELADMSVLHTKRLEEARDAYTGSKRSLQEKKETVRHLQKERIDVLGRIHAYKEREKELLASYPDIDLRCQIEGETLLNKTAIQDKFRQEEEAYRRQTEELVGQEVLINQSLKSAQQELQECIKKQETLAVEKSQAEHTLQLFEEKKSQMEKILRGYQLSEEAMYEHEKTLRILYGEAERYSRLIQDMTLDNKILKEQKKQYESERIAKLPGEVEKVLQEQGIYAEHGYEWMKNLDCDRYEKTRLLKNNPFLAASLILTQKDMDKIKQLEFQGILPAFIPLLEKEKLTEYLTKKSGKHVYCLGEAEFLVTYDERLMNKNFLKELMEEIDTKIRKNEEVLLSARESLKHTELAILKAESFTYTKEEAERILRACDKARDDLKINEQRTSELEDETDRRKDQLREIQTKRQEFKKQQENLQRKCETVLGFLNRTGEIRGNLEKKQQLEKQEEEILGQIAEIEERLERITEEIHEKEENLRNRETDIAHVRKQFLKYQDAKPAKRLYEEPENLESRLKVLTSESNGRIRNLQEILEDYRRRWEEKKEELDGLAVREEDYEGREYSATLLEKAAKEQKESEQTASDLKGQLDTVRITVAGKHSDVKYALRRIQDQCGRDCPLPQETVRNLDFKAEKQICKDTLKKLDKELVTLKKDTAALDKILFMLEEFRSFAGENQEGFFLPEQLHHWVKEQLQMEKDTAEKIRIQRNYLSDLYMELETEFVSKNEIFKALFSSILAGEKRYQPELARNAFSRAYLQIDRKLAQHLVDLKKMDDMEKSILDNTLSYLKQVYDELNSIDRNSVIDLEGRRCKMLLIELPPKENLDTLSLKEYLKETILKCEVLFRQEKSAENLLLNEINSYALFDRFVGMNKIHINLMKIEPNRLRKKSWRQVIEETSGGEKFVSAFVVFISLLTYMRGEGMTVKQNQSKVLIMDNPFGPITSEHLLKPLFEISKKYNTQMICLTDLKEHTIYDRFNFIYSLRIEREVGRDEEYLEQRTVKRELPEEAQEEVSAALFRIDDMSRFERIN